MVVSRPSCGQDYNGRGVSLSPRWKSWASEASVGFLVNADGDDSVLLTILSAAEVMKASMPAELRIPRTHGDHPACTATQAVAVCPTAGPGNRNASASGWYESGCRRRAQDGVTPESRPQAHMGYRSRRLTARIATVLQTTTNRPAMAIFSPGTGIDSQAAHHHGRHQRDPHERLQAWMPCYELGHRRANPVVDA